MWNMALFSKVSSWKVAKDHREPLKILFLTAGKMNIEQEQRTKRKCKLDLRMLR